MNDFVTGNGLGRPGRPTGRGEPLKGVERWTRAMPRRTELLASPVSAPDLTGPISFLNWPVARTPGRGRKGHRALRHAHLEIDLVPGTEYSSRVPIVHAIEEAFREAEVQELGDLLTLTAGALLGFSAAGYQEVDHWEVRPGGWLSLHHTPRRPHAGSVNAFLEAMRLREWASVRNAREFAARLRGSSGRSLEFVLRRIHRERRHSLTVDLFGSLNERDVRGLVAALGRHLPLLHASVTAVRHDEPRRST